VERGDGRAEGGGKGMGRKGQGREGEGMGIPPNEIPGYSPDKHRRSKQSEHVSGASGPKILERSGALSWWSQNSVEREHSAERGWGQRAGTERGAA